MTPCIDAYGNSMHKINRILFAVANPSIKPTLSGLSAVPPAGLLAIAGYTRQFFPHIEMKVFDFASENKPLHQQIESIRSFSPDIVALTARTFLYPATVRLSKEIKKELKDVRIIFGGQHPTLMGINERYPDCFDTVVMGEGEIAFVELINLLEKNHNLPKTYSGPFLKEISHDYAWDILQSAPFYKRPYTPLYTDAIGSVVWSRGCPFNCFFCSGPALWKGSKPRVRYRTPDSIVNELFFLHKHFGVKRVFVHDDTLNANIEKLTEICHMLIEKNNPVVLAVSGMRADFQLTPENIFPLLKKAGCRYISFGIESGDSSVLKKIGRNITHMEIERALNLTVKYGIKTCGGFTIGHIWQNKNGSLGGETENQVKITIEYIKKLLKKNLLWSIQMSIVTPIPGSALYRLALDKKLLEDYNFDELGSFDRVKLSFKHPILNQTFLLRYYRKAFRLLAFSPKHIFKLIISIKDIKDILGLLRSGYFVLINRLIDQVYLSKRRNYE